MVKFALNTSFLVEVEMCSIASIAILNHDEVIKEREMQLKHFGPHFLLPFPYGKQSSITF